MKLIMGDACVELDNRSSFAFPVNVYLFIMNFGSGVIACKMMGQFLVYTANAIVLFFPSEI